VTMHILEICIFSDSLTMHILEICIFENGVTVHIAEICIFGNGLTMHIAKICIFRAYQYDYSSCTTSYYCVPGTPVYNTGFANQSLYICVYVM
jgi:hypothetical protein